MLKRAISSVLNQDYQNFEILVVDDSQADDSEKMLKSFPPHLIKYLRKKQRVGIAAKRNLGIKLSTGEYIAFLDDDDEWLPNKLMLQINLFQRSDSNVGVVHSNCLVDDGSSTLLYHGENVSDQSMRRLLENNFVSNSTSVLKRNCFNVVGYLDEELPFCEDWDLYIRVSRRFRFRYIQEPTAILHWAINSSVVRGSLDLRRVTRGYQIFFAKHWEDYKYSKQVLSRKLWHIGINLNALGESDLAEWYFLKAYLLSPVNFLYLASFCFYTFANSAMNQKLELANVIRSLVKKKRFSLGARNHALKTNLASACTN